MKKRYEVFWIKIAAMILMGRNVKRSSVVSRKDNNRMWYIAEELDSICSRMMDEYEHF